MTPQNVVFFIELALLRLGKETLDGLDYFSRVEKARQIISHWHKRGEISDDIREHLLSCWEDFLIDVAARDRELSIRRTEGQTDTEDVHKDTHLCYVDFCQCIGNCLDPLYAA